MKRMAVNNAKCDVLILKQFIFWAKITKKLSYKHHKIDGFTDFNGYFDTSYRYFA